jgi:hypothetical protein
VQSVGENSESEETDALVVMLPVVLLVTVTIPLLEEQFTSCASFKYRYF